MCQCVKRTVPLTHPERPRITDREVQQIIRTELNLENSLQLQELPRESRDAALRLLKRKGISVRQIERITGLNRGVIQRA